MMRHYGAAKTKQNGSVKHNLSWAVKNRILTCFFPPDIGFLGFTAISVLSIQVAPGVIRLGQSVTQASAGA